MKKKFLCLSASVLFAATCMAAGYSSYSSSSDNGWVTFFFIVSLIGGVLQIILFFKIWGMTNDIRALKVDHFNERAPETSSELLSYLRNNLILGNKENVKRALILNFTKTIRESYAEMPTGGYEKDEKGVDTWVEYRDKNLTQPIDKYVNSLQKQFEKIGEELPVYIKNMKTYNDYYNMFVDEDFVVK